MRRFQRTPRSRARLVRGTLAPTSWRVQRPIQIPSLVAEDVAGRFVALTPSGVSAKISASQAGTESDPGPASTRKGDKVVPAAARSPDRIRHRQEKGRGCPMTLATRPAIAGRSRSRRWRAVRSRGAVRAVGLPPGESTETVSRSPRMWPRLALCRYTSHRRRVAVRSRSERRRSGESLPQIPCDPTNDYKRSTLRGQ